MSLESHNREHTGMERKEGRRMERFILDGIDRLLVKGTGVITVMRGKVDGALQAINLGLCPRELLPGKLEHGDGSASESEGFLRRLGCFAKGPVGRILQSVGLGCASAAGVAACGTHTDIENGHNQPSMTDDRENPEPQFGTAKLAMTEEDLLNLGEPQLVPWNGAADQWPNISEMDGKKIITFSRGMEYNNGQADKTVWYVECDDIEKCLTEGMPQPVQGLQEAFQEFTNYQYPDAVMAYGESIIYKDKDGKDKLYASGGVELGGPVKLDIAHTGEGGGLKVSNLSMADPPLVDVSGMTINGTPHLIGWDLNNYDTILLNLHTGEQQFIYTDNQCSMPHIDVNGGWWVGSRWGEYDTCKLIAAPKLEDLGKELGDYMFIESQNDKKNPWGVVESTLYNPRISGKVLIYEGGAGFYYALVQPYCGDGVPNGNETPQTCPKDFGINPGPDTVQPEPQPDTTTVLPDQDIAEETGEQIDAIVTPEDINPPKPDTVQDTVQPPIDTAEPKFDTVPPADTLPPQDTAIPPKDILNPDTGSDVPPSTDIPQDTAQDAAKPKPDTGKDTNPHEKDTPLPSPDKDTINPSKDTENPTPKPEEEESGGGGGGGGCSVTW